MMTSTTTETMALAAFTLPGSPHSARMARFYVRAALAYHGLGGYADDVFNILYRVEPRRMREEGFDHGEAGVRQFAEAYGVLEKVTTIEPSENACSKAKVTTSIKRRPGASPGSLRGFKEWGCLTLKGHGRVRRLKARLWPLNCG